MIAIIIMVTIITHQVSSNDSNLIDLLCMAILWSATVEFKSLHRNEDRKWNSIQLHFQQLRCVLICERWSSVPHLSIENHWTDRWIKINSCLFRFSFWSVIWFECTLHISNGTLKQWQKRNILFEMNWKLFLLYLKPKTRRSECKK